MKLFKNLSGGLRAGIYTLTGIYLLLVWVQWMIYRHESFLWHLEASVVLAFFVVSLGILVRVFDKWLDKYLPFEDNAILRFLIQLIVTFSVLEFLRFAVMLRLQKYLPVPVIHLNESQELTALGFATDILLSSLLVLSMMVYHFIKRWKESSVKASQLEKEKAIVQFENLKNQLNPHFLFNSLSSLNNLIYDNATLASEFLQQLSKVYRYLL
ncbi:MAG: histidine kinase, partial [Chitinophagales bacterium]|nr:histidine kinase [Chitinophagales bacterium]